MQKILAALTVATILAIAPSAMAKGAKVPKILCLDWDSFGDYHQLTFKKIGSIPNPVVKKVTTYAVTGHAWSSNGGPVSGTAYITPGTSILHASYNGFFETGCGTHTLSNFEIFFDLSTGTGDIDYRFICNNESFIDGSDGITAQDCSDPMLDIPASVAAGPAKSASSR